MAIDNDKSAGAAQAAAEEKPGALSRRGAHAISRKEASFTVGSLEAELLKRFPAEHADAKASQSLRPQVQIES